MANGLFQKYGQADNEVLANFNEMSQQELADHLNGVFETSEFTKSSVAKAMRRLKVKKGQAEKPLQVQIDEDRKVLRLKAEVQLLTKKNEALMKDADLQELLLGLARENIEALPQVQAPSERKFDKDITEEVVVLDWSDAHMDEIVYGDQLGGLNFYNFEVFCKRLEQMSDSIHSIVGKMSGYELKKLYVNALGDFVSGIIHDDLNENADGTVFETVFNGALVASQFLSEMLTVFDTIEFTGVVGNHGRMTKDVRYKNRYVNWDYFFYQVLALMMVNNPRIKFDIPRSFWCVKTIGGRRHLLLHGDNIKGWNGIPWYGINRATSRLLELLQKRDAFDDVHIAHFHNQGTLDRVAGETFINGSMIGGNEYSIGALFASGVPKQLLMGVNPKKQRITWRFPLDLSDGDLKESTRYKFSDTIVIADQVRDLYF